jgi:hypothetical protein
MLRFIQCRIPFIDGSGYDYQQVKNESIEIEVQGIGTMIAFEDYFEKQIVAAGKDSERKEVISQGLIVSLYHDNSHY